MSERAVRILGLGTATPASVEQSHITAIAQTLIDGTASDREALDRVFTRCGVERRGIALVEPHGERQREPTAEPIQMLEALACRAAGGSVSASPSRASTSVGVDALARFYPPGDPPSTHTRMLAFARLAPPLAERACRAALEAMDVGSITHLITVSCTGFVSPGVDAHLIESLGLSAGVRRLNIGFMGCHAALNAMEQARSIASADAHARVLVVCVELCSLHMSYGRSMEKIVANALFADGSASLVVGQSDDSNCWEIVRGASLLLPVDTRVDMGWTVGNVGFEMTLSSRVPSRVEAGIRAWCDAWLGEAGTGVHAIDHWAVHPGGPKVLTSAARGLQIEESHTRMSREVLRDHGNMSSTTVLFILQQLGQARGRCVSLAFGPGLVMEGVLLKR
jgi:prepilin-type processing-associated H-X9-DG protein